jgi:hypothetical protein
VLTAQHDVSSTNNTTDMVISSWVDFQGLKYPKIVELTFYENGQKTIEKTYTLLRIHPDKTGPVSVTLREGGLIRDDDTNITYDVKNGKLIPNPMFNRETGIAATVRRDGFLVAFLILVAWTVVRYRSLQQKKVQPASTGI